MTVFSAHPGHVEAALAESDVASRRRRLFAALVDYLFLYTGPGIGAVLLAALAVLDQSNGLLLLALVLLMAPFFVEAVLTGLWGQTPGKYLLAIRVVSAVDGSLPGMGAGFLRTLVKYLPGVLLLPAGVVVVGWVMFDPQRQGLHDKASTTIVIRRR